MNYVKFLTNRKESIAFKFDTGLEKEGKFGPQYAYGVEWNGEEAYLYATAALNGLLQQLGGLKGRTLEIEKAQDPNDLKRTYWVIYENGQEITPRGNHKESGNQQMSPQNTPDIVGRLEALEKAVKFLMDDYRNRNKTEVPQALDPETEDLKLDTVPF